jgi:hypothetical protein
MTTALLILLALVVLDVAALLWGADSREPLDSLEWERKRNFPPL